MSAITYRTSVMRGLVPMLLAVGMTAPASAGEGIFCHGAGDQVDFRMSSSLGQDFLEPLFATGAEVNIGLESFPPEARQGSFGLDDLKQWWHDEEILNLRFVAQLDDDPGASMQLLITTRQAEDGWYRGTFTITLSQSPDGQDLIQTVAGGEAQCGADGIL